MKPGVIYRGVFVNTETTRPLNENIQQECTVNIYDTAILIPDDQDPQIVELEMADQPLVTEVIDNSEDNFTPIRSKQLTINIFSGNGISVSLFAYGADKRYKVEYLIESQVEPKFVGWLSISDLSMDFQPDPNVITMIANDGLGFLSDIAVTDFFNENPTHQNTILDYIIWMLSKTGLQLDMVCCFNIRHKNAGTINPSVTLSTSFTAPNTFIAPITGFFFPGMTFTVSGTVSNNGTFTVVSVVETTVSDVTVSETVITEFANTATFTKSAASISAGHFFKFIWLDAKTFEEDIGTCINCYEAFLRILKEEATIYQDNGTWFIMRKDEYEFLKPFYLFRFDYLGNFISQSEENFEKSIGVDLPMAWMDDNALVSLERPARIVTETYDFETPLEIPDNVDYERGDLTTRVIEAGYAAYNLNDWAIGNLWGSATTLPDIDAVILRSFTQLGDEETRFIMFTEPPGTTGAFEYIRSSPIPVGYLDRFTFSFDVSAMTNPGGDGIVQVCFIVLYGADGNVYILNPANTSTTWLNTDPTPPLTWHLTNAQLSLFRTGLNWAIFPDDDKTEWSACTIPSVPVPVDGEVRIFLFAGNQGGGVPSFKIRYQNLGFAYRAYIAGTYQKYVGQRHRVEGGTDTVAARDEQVYVTDSPKRLYKGAFQKTNGLTLIHSGSIVFAAPNAMSISGYKVVNFDVGTRLIITGTNDGVYRITDVIYHTIGNTTEIQVEEQTITTVTESATLSKYIFALANEFYNAAVYPVGNFPSDAVHPYGLIQVFDVWNQYNRVMSKFEGVIDGLESDGEMPDLKHKYFLTDGDPTTVNKMFQLLHFNQDQHLCQWNAFLHEVADSTIGKVYTGNSFKYITQKK